MTEKILIVDDDVDSLKLIGLMLQRHGYEVLAANTGNQALMKAESDQPNLIILDVMMPDMNGLEVCRRLRGNAKTNGIPIIMFTAKTMIDDKVKGFEAGADDYLTKPTHPAELASRVKAILARSVAKNEAPPPVAASRPRGQAIGILGAKGGVGTTTIAINLAAALLQAGENPILADLRPGQGSMALLLGLVRTQNMARFLAGSPSDITDKAIEGALAAHQSGLRVLASAPNAREALGELKPENASAVVQVLRTLAKPAIIDLGAGYSPLVNKVIADIDRIILVVEPNGLTLSLARELMKQLDEDGVGSRVSIAILNRSQSSLQTSWQEVENLLGRDIKAIISPAPELAFQAIENKMPLVMLQPSSVVASQFVKLADEMRSKIKSIAGNTNN